MNRLAIPIQSLAERLRHPSIMGLSALLVTTIMSAIIIAMVLMVFSMYLYGQSGAAQLDLSRPAYQAVRNQIKTSDQFTGFTTNQKLNEQNVAEFKKMYRGKYNDITKHTGAFNPADISDQTLGISAE